MAGGQGPGIGGRGSELRAKAGAGEQPERDTPAPETDASSPGPWPPAPGPRSAVLLLAHGAPERVEDVESYLGYVRGGRPASPRILEEVRSRYVAIGGSSPLTAWTRAQAEALQQRLGVPVFFGMRNWHPFIRETMDRIREAGVERIAAIALAPQYSDLSVGLYIRRTEEAAREAGVTAEIAWAKSYHDEPLLIDAFAERLKLALAECGAGNPDCRPLQRAFGPLPASSTPAEAGGGQDCPPHRVLFTAHSLPEKILAAGDPYDRETRATAAAVARRVGLSGYDFAYQSQGFTDDTWLGPTVESTLERYAAEGVRSVVLAPIGFVCDHVEILFDVDVLFREYAAARGIALRRPESLNGSAMFTAALAEVAKRCLP
jgi:protoporphyrin/coproporphyrin ferrochelatase